MERKKRERDEKEIKREGFHHAAVFVKGISDVTYIPYHRWFPSVHQSKETGKKQQKYIITSGTDPPASFPGYPAPECEYVGESLGMRLKIHYYQQSQTSSGMGLCLVQMVRMNDDSCKHRRM